MIQCVWVTILYEELYTARKPAPNSLTHFNTKQLLSGITSPLGQLAIEIFKNNILINYKYFDKYSWKISKSALLIEKVSRYTLQLNSNLIKTSQRKHGCVFSQKTCTIELYTVLKGLSLIYFTFESSESNFVSTTCSTGSFDFCMKCCSLQ